MPKLVSFSAIAEVNPPLRVAVPRTGSAVSFIPMADVSDSGEWTHHQVRDVGSLTSGFTSFEEGDVLFAKITPCMENGKGCHAVGLAGGIGFGSTEFIVLRAREGNDPRFVFHWTRSPALRRAAENSMSGSAGQQRVSPSFFDAFKIPEMSPAEQGCIGRVLDTLDEAIRRARAVIEKLRKVRTGFVSDLLARGIGENGELRDPFGRPELFRESRLGRVPKAWSVVTVGEVLAEHGGHVQTGPFGSQLHASEYSVDGIPVVMPRDIGSDGRLNRRSAARIPVQRASYLRRHFMECNDVLFARRGDLSRCSAIGALEAGMICGTGCLLMRCPERAMRAGWFALAYKEDACQRQIAARAVGTTMVNLNTKLVLDLTIALPGAVEQERIEAVMGGVDAVIAKESGVLEKLELIKQGVMTELTSGALRVITDRLGRLVSVRRDC